MEADKGGGAHTAKIEAEARKGTPAEAHTDTITATAETGMREIIAEAEIKTAGTEVRTEANTRTPGEARTDAEGADQPARERVPVTERGHRVARQGGQPGSTAPNLNVQGPDRGPAAWEEREPSRTSRADTITLAQIAGTGTVVTHTPRRKKALYRNVVP